MRIKFDWSVKKVAINDKGVMRVKSRRQAIEQTKKVIGPRLDQLKLIVQDELRAWLINSPTLQSLKSEDDYSLRGHFGLDKEAAIQVVDDIIDTWCDNIRVTDVKTVNKVLRFKIELVNADYSDVLALPYTSYISNRSGETIEWLSWLLNYGDSIRILQWWYYPGQGRATSRSGKGIMVPGRKRFWKIPSGFDFPPDNNFILQILKDTRFHELVRKAYSTII